MPSATAWAGSERQGTTGAPLCETDIARWKRVLGDGLRLQPDRRQEAEVAIAADVVIRMRELGCPEYVLLT